MNDTGVAQLAILTAIVIALVLVSLDGPWR
jgi:hypothetical protein